MDAMTTATQNLVVAFNNNTKAATNVAGEVTSLTYAGPTQVILNPGACRLVNLCIVISGTGDIQFYNSQSLNALPANSLVYILEGNAPIGITQVGLNFSSGLAMIVGDGVSVNCTYSIAR